jgi:arabinogalactan endo-1,4-beta-galactosidase
MKGIYFNDWALFNSSQLLPDAPPGVPVRPPLGLYAPPVADQSLKNLAETGANWIALSVRVGQETISSTKISRSENATATDSELRHVIDLAHSLGMRVLLMPLLHLSNDPTHGHIYIGTTFNSETQWQEWFASYREFISSYATFAQEAGVDMFFMGNELGGTTHREADWRQVIQEVRLRYKGPITYDSLCGGFPFPMGEDLRIKWWDAVDYIGVGGYYPLTNKNAPTVEELKTAWVEKGYIDELENLSKKFNKPVIISEIGYESKDGANKIPAYFNLTAPIDLQEQADCYQAAFEVLWGKPWLKGIFWFQWFSNPKPREQGGLNSVNCTPEGKPAEEVLKKFYLSQ